jgi:hypothetical protein
LLIRVTTVSPAPARMPRSCDECMMCRHISCYTTCATQHPSCRDLTIFLDSIWSQLAGPSQQPASAAACIRFLEPDILEVSPVWLYVMKMCVLGDPGTKHTLTVHLYIVADRSSPNRQLESVLIPFRGVRYLACRDSRTLMICGRVYATHPQTYVSISCSDVDLIPFRRRMIFCLHVLMLFYAFCFATAI